MRAGQGRPGEPDVPGAPGALRLGRRDADGRAPLSSLAAAADVAGLREGRLRLKWPNDLVVGGEDGEPRKVAGVLGESVFGPEGAVETAIVGIGGNAAWAA